MTRDTPVVVEGDIEASGARSDALYTNISRVIHSLIKHCLEFIKACQEFIALCRVILNPGTLQAVEGLLPGPRQEEGAGEDQAGPLLPQDGHPLGARHPRQLPVLCQSASRLVGPLGN